VSGARGGAAGPAAVVAPGQGVIVTGAGRSLGRGVALAFAAGGARVVIAARGENGRETERLARARGGDATWVQCDVTSRDDVQKVVDFAVQAFGRLDTVIHNAVSGRSSDVTDVADVDEALWREHALVSLRGTYYFAQAALPHLQASKGRYILVTSSQAIEGSDVLPVYSCVKAALRNLTKGLAREWAPLGVNVTAISPLAMTDAHRRHITDPKLPGLKERLLGGVPLGYFGDPEEDLAPGFVFLASEGARYITGQTLAMDGGRTMFT
jgi:NAD(P)-dependent dehydrogenase (short-subunit alcohol dehydrogenase family)